LYRLTHLQLKEQFSIVESLLKKFAGQRVWANSPVRAIAEESNSYVHSSGIPLLNEQTKNQCGAFLSIIPYSCFLLNPCESGGTQWRNPPVPRVITTK
jgi:hypothetical protein